MAKGLAVGNDILPIRHLCLRWLPSGVYIVVMRVIRCMILEVYTHGLEG